MVHTVTVTVTATAVMEDMAMELVIMVDMAMDMDKLGIKYLCPVVGKQPPEHALRIASVNSSMAAGRSSDSLEARVATVLEGQPCVHTISVADFDGFADHRRPPSLRGLRGCGAEAARLASASERHRTHTPALGSLTGLTKSSHRSRGKHKVQSVRAISNC